MSYIISAILIGTVIFVYFFIKRRLAARTAGPREPEKVKAETYIVCPRCGERMIIEIEKNE
jgi:DNA-directed RNA polymerase subunit RPC12/RpoP